MIAVGGVLLLLAVATSPVRVVRIVDDGCPSGAEVDLALASMLTTVSGAAPASQDVAKLERRADKLHVELTDPDGVVIAERTLDGSASCAELGRMAAIVIASWESDVHPEFVRQPAEIVRVERAPPVERPAAPRPARRVLRCRRRHHVRPGRHASPPALRSGATGFRAARVPDSRSSARATSRARSPWGRTRRAGSGGPRASSSRGAGRRATAW